VRHASEAQGPELIATIESQMFLEDPAAFDDHNNWWPLIIEQMNQGLL
jgi:hypothetical protein